MARAPVHSDQRNPMNPFNMPLREPTSLDVIYETIGEDGIARIVEAFYRQVPSDDVLAPMYPKEDLKGSEERLRDFLLYRFGGPQRYIEKRGHPRLRMRHSPFPIDQRARDRWITLMDNAVGAAAPPPRIDATLKEFFRNVATFLINRDANV